MKTTRARMFARDLMTHFGLTDWGFAFDGAARRFGLCSYKRKQITLSAPLTRLNEEPEVLDTVLHEIAHAIAGAGAGHGPLWKVAALTIGCRPQRCYSPEKVALPPAPFMGTCPSCGRIIERFQRRKIACGRCCKANGGAFAAKYLFSWSRIRHFKIPAALQVKP